MLCFCGGCPKDIPRVEDFDYWCPQCAKELGIKQTTWVDDLDIHLGYCTGCGIHRFVVSIRKEDECTTQNT